MTHIQASDSWLPSNKSSTTSGISTSTSLLAIRSALLSDDLIAAPNSYPPIRARKRWFIIFSSGFSSGTGFETGSGS